MKKYLAFLVMLFAASSSFAFYRSNYNLTLSNGETVHIDQFLEMYAGGSDEWLLAIQYDADDVQNIPVLCERAKLIWPHLRPLVEAKGWSWGSIRADKKTVITTSVVFKTKKTESVGWAVGYKKVDGKWTIMNKDCKQD